MAANATGLATYKWLLPTRLELVAYFLLGLLTVLLSNVQAIEHILAAGSGFDFRDVTLKTLGSRADTLLGGNVPATAVIFTFWAVVGLVVYLMLWAASNFISQMGANLAARKYLHPEGTDPNYLLKAYIIRGFLRIIGIAVLLYYLGFLVQVLLPLCTDAFKALLQSGFELASIKTAFIMLALEIAALHLIAVCARLALLRKRVFGGYLD